MDKEVVYMDKEVIVYGCHGILFSHEKEGNPAICDNMDRPCEHYAKWHKSER